MPVSSGDRLLQVLSHTVDCLLREETSYVLMGAWALGVWGQPRATLDLDFLVGVNERDLVGQGERMTQAGMRVDDAWMEANPLLKGTQLRLRYKGVAIDLLRPRDRHDQQTLRRGRRKRLAGRYYRIVAPEDLIIQKLKVGRPRDFEDVLTVLERSGKILDRQYLRQWAKRIGVLKELEYVLSV